METAIPIVLAWLGPIVSGYIIWYTRERVSSRIRTEGEQRLSEFRHGLDRISAAANFDYQRQLQDFNLFIAKKHEVMAELYQLIVEAHSRVLGAAMGMRGIPVLDDHSAEDADAYMLEAGNFPSSKRKEIVALWDVDQKGAMRMLDEHLASWEPENARRSLVKAVNYRIKYELYLPDEIARQAAEVTEHLYWLQDFPEQIVKKQEFTARLESLKLLMKAALTRSELMPTPAALASGGAGVSMQRHEGSTPATFTSGR